MATHDHSKLPALIFDKIIRELFDQPVISNLYRPHYVERMVALALGEGFTLVSADWAGWDIESAEGLRVEVKQAAAWQTWTDAMGEPKPSAGGFRCIMREGPFLPRMLISVVLGPRHFTRAPARPS
jgi:hypothetical protein